MKDAKKPAAGTHQHERDRNEHVKMSERQCADNEKLSSSSKDDSIHHNLEADSAELTSERTTSDDLIGFCEKHVVMFWPEKCFICESRARSRNSAEQERQIAQLRKFAELAATLGQKNTEMAERLTGTKLTVDVLSEWLRQTRAQLAVRDHQIAQLQREIAALKAA